MASESDMTDAERIAEIKEREAKATAGPWHYDTVHCEGDYGAGDNPAHGFDAYQVLTYVDGRWQAVVDTLNSDLTVVHEESDDDGGKNAWDETGRKNVIFIAEARADIPWLLSALSASQARVRELIRVFDTRPDLLSTDENEALNAACEFLGVKRGDLTTQDNNHWPEFNRER